MVGVNHLNPFFDGSSVACTNAVSLRFISAAMACLQDGVVADTVHHKDQRTGFCHSFLRGQAADTPQQDCLQMDDQQMHQPVRTCAVLFDTSCEMPHLEHGDGRHFVSSASGVYTLHTKIVGMSMKRAEITIQNAPAPLLPRHHHVLPPPRLLRP